ncbi:peptidoglycan-binding domain-containing protein [Streptomyces sp. NPDC046862]|uniref:peptidoglycan-binding domain-containing protein n=1 Tax=Streptomyces sp. NPDC046862 TaxID=3154603 RepID=UPI0034568E85
MPHSAQSEAPRATSASAVLPEHGSQDVCNFTKQRPTLQIGSSGRAVQQAQCYLNNAMSSGNLDVDGDFGSVTKSAVLRFQHCAGITVDGVVGAQTWSFLVFWANSTDTVC